MSDYIQITFPGIQPEQQELLIAHLSEAGYEGFEQSDEFLQAFIPQNDYDAVLLSEIAFKYQLTFTTQVIPEQNWNEIWEASFQPVIIDDLAAIRAHFHKPITNVRYEIIITPKMSFGTGHHATTAMMMRLMGKIDFAGTHVFDFGTGTGLLAILASMMGASSVVAVDNDEWSIRNATENIQANGCTNIRLLLRDEPISTESYQVILANINKHVILDHFKTLVERLSQNGTILVSGVLEADREEIITGGEKYQLRFIEESRVGEWICLRFSG